MPDFEVTIVDDDARVRSMLVQLANACGYVGRGLAMADEYLALTGDDRLHCLLLDVMMPGMSGLDLQRHLVQRGGMPPIVFMSGHADVAMCAQAMKAGAVDFLVKPIRPHELIDALDRAQRLARAARLQRDELAGLRQRLSTLTTREREVLALISAGRLNKQIAGDLGLSEPTVKLHRSTLMTKMKADSVASLVRMNMLLLGDRTDR